MITFHKEITLGQPVVQWQILAKDPEAFLEFYKTLFNWTVSTDNPLGYREVCTGSDRGIQGGIWPAPPEGHAMVSLYIEVDDVAAAAQKASDMGAMVVVPPQVLPQGDEMAVIVGPEGIPFGLMKYAAVKS
jgi:predicted enzyme related to lactoylglutathione lyase